jgi:cold shock CspA family protein
VTDEVIGRGPDAPPPEPTTAGIQRSLVVMDRASRAAIGEVGFPLVLLIAALAAALSFGRIGLFPLVSRGERQVGVVRLYEPEAGFGLVVRESDGGEVFFHRSAIPRWRRGKVAAGAVVEFRSIPGPFRDFVTMLRPAS